MEDSVHIPTTPKRSKNKSSHPKNAVLWTHEIVDYSPFGAAVPAVEFPYRKLPKQIMLDTSTLDLLIRNPNRLSHNALRLINECEEGGCISSATVLEWANWIQRGYYQLETSLDTFFEQIIHHWQLQIVPLPLEAYSLYTELPIVTAEMKMPERNENGSKMRKMVHDDQYDQLIAAHAIIAKMPLLSPHVIFKNYERFGLKWAW
ncbi:type II toxin-antitoxin system VapC family toxin [Runella sp.]|uniref:type II toxin-antitoxin system VapC family toxin n=1 Tax=Runella sp. TaxID=1960881 RepID=UPI003D1481C1